MAAAAQAFEVIAAASVSTSAQNAKELGYLRPTDRITPNRDRLLADARALALELADGYVPPEPRMLTVAGPAGQATLELTAAQRAADRGGQRTMTSMLVGELRLGADRRRRGDPIEPVPEAPISAARAGGIGGLIRHPQTTRSHRSHARDRKAAAELTCRPTALRLADFAFVLERGVRLRAADRGAAGLRGGRPDDRAGRDRPGGRAGRDGVAAAEHRRRPGGLPVRGRGGDDADRVPRCLRKLVDGGWCGLAIDAERRRQRAARGAGRRASRRSPARPTWPLRPIRC